MYTIAIYTTPMSFPLNFTVHSWVEISNESKTDRYDLWAYPGKKTATSCKGYIYKNIFPRHLGTTFSPIAKMDDLSLRQTGEIYSQISGGQGSTAHLLYEKISREAFLYPAYDRYSMIFGPNCNTFTQWLIRLTPDTGLHLPWHAWGKNTKL